MRALLLVRHGPEIRLLDSLRNSGRYSDVSLLIEAVVAVEIEGYAGSSTQCFAYKQTESSWRIRKAHYLSALMDSLARRVNRLRGISYYSYARRVEACASSSSLGREGTVLFMRASLNIAFHILALLAGWLFRDQHLLNTIRHSGCGVLVSCDHLGGSDSVTYNAKQAGLQVHYYLNNHKDLSIRPYVPVFADSLFTWFNDQMSTVLDICRSHQKMSAIGMLRADTLLKYASGYCRKPENLVIRVLHCCADSRRRPYEMRSLFQIFRLIQDFLLPVRFTLRLNPMGAPLGLDALKEFSFVEVVGHGWHWDDTKFLNFPDATAEAAYAYQIVGHDVISALPSTTLVEGYCFNKPVVCFLDADSPDAEAEEGDLRLCVPECVLAVESTLIARSPKEYLDILLRIGH